MHLEKFQNGQKAMRLADKITLLRLMLVSLNGLHTELTEQQGQAFEERANPLFEKSLVVLFEGYRFLSLYLFRMEKNHIYLETPSCLELSDEAQKARPQFQDINMKHIFLKYFQSNNRVVAEAEPADDDPVNSLSKFEGDCFTDATELFIVKEELDAY